MENKKKKTTLFRNAQTDGLCSQCFREKKKRKMSPAESGSADNKTEDDAAPTTPTPAAPVLPAIVTTTAPAADADKQVVETTNTTPRSPAVASLDAEHAAGGGASPLASPKKVTSAPTSPSGGASKGGRCDAPDCRAKLRLTAVRCRCQLTFCDKHRHAEAHACTFDYKAATRKDLELKNAKVVAEKVARI